MLKKLCAILFLLLAAATPVLAQDDDFGAAGTVVVEKAVNLRRDPSTARPRIDLLAPGNALRLVDPEPVNGFYRVVNDKGELGWVWA
jgi:uncharacterized protein YgiM (DUF1202 family)